MLIARARLARLLGDEDRYRGELSEAHRLLIEMGAPIRAEQVAKELAGYAGPASQFSSLWAHRG